MFKIDNKIANEIYEAVIELEDAGNKAHTMMCELRSDEFEYSDLSMDDWNNRNDSDPRHYAALRLIWDYESIHTKLSIALDYILMLKKNIKQLDELILKTDTR